MSTNCAPYFTTCVCIHVKQYSYETFLKPTTCSFTSLSDKLVKSRLYCFILCFCLLIFFFFYPWHCQFIFDLWVSMSLWYLLPNFTECLNFINFVKKKNKPKEEGFPYTLIFSSILIQMDYLKLESLSNAMFFTFVLSTTHFSAVSYFLFTIYQLLPVYFHIFLFSCRRGPLYKNC